MFKQKWKDLFDVVRIRPLASLGQVRDFFSSTVLKQFKSIRTVCSYPWTSLFVLWNGDIGFCMNDVNHLITLGNLKKDFLFDIWISQKFNKLREALRNKCHTEFCKNCIVWNGKCVNL